MPAPACPRCSTTWVPTDEFLGACPKCVLGWAVDAPTDPERVGDYRILGRLGAGGMGVVYRARQAELGRDVALKLLAAGEDAERFLREARAVAKLSHPSIVPVFEVGRHEGRPFYAMELVDGPTLAGKLAAGPLEAREAASIVAQAARALDHAHQAGILHRDVKPSNLLLGADGRPRLADFGIARDLTRETRATASGSVVGTPAYMAPEQVEGEPGPATDTYQLGATLYECLTGAPPFDGPTPARVLYRVLHEEPAPPRSRRPEVPRDLEAVCLKALSKATAERYARPDALAEDLERFLRGEPVVARATPGVVRVGRAAAKQKFVIGLTAGLLVAVTVALLRPGPPDESAARERLAEARERTDPRAAPERHRLLREARELAKTDALRRQIDDLLGIADASPWFFLLVGGGAPPLESVAPAARPHLERALGGGDALEEIEIALANDPNWRVWLAASVVRLRDGDPSGAVEAARRARLLAPELRAAAAFEAVIQRAGWHFGGAAPEDPLAREDRRDPLIALAAALVPHVDVERDGMVRIAWDTWSAAALEEVPPPFRAVRGWLRLMAEDAEGAKRDLEGAPAGSAEWNGFVERVRRAAGTPDEPWLLLAQARVRLAKGRDPEPKVARLLEVLGPANDPRLDVFYRWPALNVRAKALARAGDAAGAERALARIPPSARE